MKPAFLVLFVVSLAFAVVAANHHKKHKGNNVKVEEYATTFFPNEGDGADGAVGDFEWPDPSSIRNFDLPAAFDFGRKQNSNTEAVPAKQHGRSNHRSHSQ